MIAEGANKIFKILVLPLSLTISLGMECGAKSPYTRKIVAKGGLKITYEKRTTIRNNSSRDSKEANDIVYEDLSEVAALDIFSSRDIESIFCKSVDNYQYRVAMATS